MEGEARVLAREEGLGVELLKSRVGLEAGWDDRHLERREGEGAQEDCGEEIGAKEDCGHAIS